MILHPRVGGEIVRWPVAARSTSPQATTDARPAPPRRPARGLIVDLDDTLYPRRQFLLSGFSAVAAHVAALHGVDVAPLLAALTRALDAGEANRAFQRLCTEYTLPQTDVQQLLQVFRDHVPTLAVDDDVAGALRRMRASGWRIAILTNGLPSVQDRKLTALGAAALVDHVVFAEQFAPKGKPAAETFRHALTRLNLPASRCVCVGDDPVNDIAGARALGLRTIRITRHTAFTPLREADAIVRTFEEVPGVAGLLLEKGASDAA
jgi:putative hydrolase of the HAD superfamily